MHIDRERAELHPYVLRLDHLIVKSFKLTREDDRNNAIIDFLKTNNQFIPEEWITRNGVGNITHIELWRVVSCYPNGDVFVKCSYFEDESWHEFTGWFAKDFYHTLPKVVRIYLSGG
ncbi:MAG: hypothetical protein WCT26_04610 [Candidatus Buchananbacteria bacterium]